MQKQELKSADIKVKIQAFIDESNILICPGCLEQYDQKNITPIIICNNQHTLCHQCVQNKIFCKNSITAQFQCILCREDILRPPLKKAQKQIQYINLTKKLKKIFAPYIDEFTEKHSQFDKQFTKTQNKLKKINQKHKQYDQEIIKLTMLENNYQNLLKKQKKGKEQIDKKITKIQKSIKDTHEYQMSKIKQDKIIIFQNLEAISTKVQQKIDFFKKQTQPLENWIKILGVFVLIILAFCIALKIQFSSVGNQAQYLTNSSVQIHELFLNFAKQYNAQFKLVNNKITFFEKYVNQTFKLLNNLNQSLVSKEQTISANYSSLFEIITNFNVTTNAIAQKVDNLSTSIVHFQQENYLLNQSFSLLKNTTDLNIRTTRAKVQEIHVKVINHSMTYPKYINMLNITIKSEILKLAQTIALNSRNYNNRLLKIQNKIIQYNLSKIWHEINDIFSIIKNTEYFVKVNNAIFDSHNAIQNLKILNRQINIIKNHFQESIFRQIGNKNDICLKTQYNAFPFRPILIKFIPDLNLNETFHFAFYKNLNFAQLNKYQNVNNTYGQRSVYYGVVSIDKIQTTGVSQFNVVLQFTESMDIFIGVVTEKGRNLSQAIYTSQFAGFYYKYRMFMLNGNLKVDKKIFQNPYQREIQTLVRINQYNYTMSVLLTYDYTDYYYQIVLPQKLQKIELFPALYMKTDKDIVQFNFKRNQYFNMHYKHVLATRMQEQRAILLQTKYFRNESHCDSQKAFSRLTNLRYYNMIPKIKETRNNYIKNIILENTINKNFIKSNKVPVFKPNHQLPKRNRPNHIKENRYAKK